MDLWYGMDARYTRFLRECSEIIEAIWRWDSALYDVRYHFVDSQDKDMNTTWN